jgi:hypothetical protein
MQTVDYSAQFPDALVAQGRDREFLAIFKCQPFKRMDGKMASYEVVNRSLSRTCQRENDGAYACVLGYDVSYWQAKELAGLLPKIKKGKDVDLFEEFRLFP